MKEIFLLTKILLKSSTNDSKKVGEKKKNSFGRFAFFIFIYAYVIGFMAYISYNIIKSLILVNQPAIFFSLASILLLGIGIIQTAISGLNILYFSKDLEFLLPMPITPKKIVIAKLNCLVISQYFMMLMLVLPGTIIYGYLLKLGFMYYLMAIIALLVFPIIPVAIVSGIIAIIMKFTKIIKNKEVVQYLTIFLTLFLIIAIQSVSGTSGNISAEELANDLVKTNGLVEKFSSIILNIKLMTNVILNYNNIKGIINLLALIIISTTIYYIISVFISKIYVNTVLSINTVRSKKTSNINETKDLKTNNIFISYLKKEFKLLVRNPIFFMQCVLPSIIFPIIIGVPAIYGIQDSGVNLNQFAQEFSQIINTSFGIMCFIVAIIFMYLFNYTSVTAISRDGQNSVFMKYIPVSLKKQLLYKATPGILLNLVPTIYILLLGMIVFKGIELNTYIYIFIITLLINILNNILSVLVDLKNPKLKWITEYAVVKQNFNMIFGILFIVVEIVTVIWMGNNIKNINEFATILIITLFASLIAIKKYVAKKEVQVFDKIV